MNYFSTIINYTRGRNSPEVYLLNFSATRSVEDTEDVREHGLPYSKLELMEYVDYEHFVVVDSKGQ